MKPGSGYIAANGINHHYLEWGNASNPPLLMLHATGLCAHPWQPIAQVLAQNYHVLALDQRGHGDTEPSDRGYSFELVGEDLAETILAMGISQLRMVGHSSGGLASPDCRFPAAGTHYPNGIGGNPCWGKPCLGSLRGTSGARPAHQVKAVGLGEPGDDACGIPATGRVQRLG